MEKTRIIFGMILQGAGVGFLYAMVQAKGNEGFAFLGLGAAASIVGIIMTLSGLRDFFLRDILDELRSIKQRIPIPAAPPVSIDPKHLCFEPDPSSTTTE